MKSKFEVKGGDLYIDGNKVIKAYEGCNGWRWFATEVIYLGEGEFHGDFSKNDFLLYGFIQGYDDHWGTFNKVMLELNKPHYTVSEINPCDLPIAGRRG